MFVFMHEYITPEIQSSLIYTCGKYRYQGINIIVNLLYKPMLPPVN